MIQSKVENRLDRRDHPFELEQQKSSGLTAMSGRPLTSHASARDSDKLRADRALHAYGYCEEVYASLVDATESRLDKNNADISYWLDSRKYPHVYFDRDEGPGGHPLNCKLVRTLLGCIRAHPM